METVWGSLLGGQVSHCIAFLNLQLYTGHGVIPPLPLQCVSCCKGYHVIVVQSGILLRVKRKHCYNVLQDNRHTQRWAPANRRYGHLGHGADCSTFWGDMSVSFPRFEFPDRNVLRTDRSVSFTT